MAINLGSEQPIKTLVPELRFWPRNTDAELTYSAQFQSFLSGVANVRSPPHEDARAARSELRFTGARPRSRMAGMRGREAVVPKCAPILDVLAAFAVAR